MSQEWHLIVVVADLSRNPDDFLQKYKWCVSYPDSPPVVRMGTDTNQHTTRQNQLPIRAGIDTGYLHCELTELTMGSQLIDQEMIEAGSRQQFI